MDTKTLNVAAQYPIAPQLAQLRAFSWNARRGTLQAADSLVAEVRLPNGATRELEVRPGFVYEADEPGTLISEVRFRSATAGSVGIDPQYPGDLYMLPSDDHGTVRIRTSTPPANDPGMVVRALAADANASVLSSTPLVAFNAAFNAYVDVRAWRTLTLFIIASALTAAQDLTLKFHDDTEAQLWTFTLTNYIPTGTATKLLAIGHGATASASPLTVEALPVSLPGFITVGSGVNGAAGQHALYVIGRR